MFGSEGKRSLAVMDVYECVFWLHDCCVAVMDQKSVGLIYINKVLVCSEGSNRITVV